MANEKDPNVNEPDESGKGTPAPQDDDSTPPAEDGLKDKHGEGAINRGRYDRDMRAKDDQIAELTKQLEEATGKAESGAKALKEIEELKAQLADKEVTTSLKLAGCINEKAAKALLDDYDGDVSKLREACPYLFRKQGGSTGARPGGAPDATADKISKAFARKR